MPLVSFDFLKFEYASNGFNGAVIAKREDEDGERYTWYFASNPHLTSLDDVRACTLDSSWTAYRPNAQMLLLNWLQVNTPEAEA